MGRIYKTTDIMAGGVRVSVRQVLGSGDSRIPQIIAAATVTAQHWLALVIPSRGSAQYKELIDPIFRFCFHTDAGSNNTNIVFSVLQTIRSAISQPFGVKVIDMRGGTIGYVTRYYSGCIQQAGGGYQYDEDDDVIHRRGEIHLRKGILGDGDLTAVTLIHEAGHKFANLRDHGDAGYFKSNYQGYEDNTLSWQQCMYNADSYAVFTYLVANPALAKKRVPGLIRGARRAESQAAGDDYSSIGNLFS